MNEEGYYLHPLIICNRLLNFIRKKLPTFSLKPITLGCFGLLICHRLINPIIQILASQAIKPVTLGCPTISASVSSGGPSSCPGGEFGHAGAVMEPSQVQENDAEKRVQEKVGIQARAPKKAASINDNVEEIIKRKKRKRKKTATDKLSSMEKGKERDEQKPLKSVLKVGYQMNEKWDSKNLNV